MERATERKVISNRHRKRKVNNGEKKLVKRRSEKWKGVLKERSKGQTIHGKSERVVKK